MMGKRAFTQTISDLLKMIVIRSFPSFAKILKLGVFSSEVTKFFHDVVEETMTFREANSVSRNDFLQLLMQLKNNGCLDGDIQAPVGTSLTLDEAAAQAFIFFLAGFETTSTTISFALFEMAQNDSIQAKARQEVRKILGKYEGNVCYEAVMEMEYLEMVISGE